MKHAKRHWRIKQKKTKRHIMTDNFDNNMLQKFDKKKTDTEETLR